MWKCVGCQEKLGDDFDVCWNCGADREGRADPAFRRADEPDPPPPPSAGISVNCPACGKAEFKAVRSLEWVAFSNDKICLACDTRYTPPTPRWAAVVFLGIGILFTAGALADFLLILLAVDFRHIPAMVVSFLFGMLGLASLRHGWRALRKQGRS